MKRKLYRAWQMRLFLGGLLGVVALFAAAAYFSGPMVWASNEHVHLATDWSHRHMVFSAPKTWWQSFNLSRNPRYVQQWVRRNAEKKNINHRPPHHEAVLKGDWSNYIGGNNATAGAGVFPAKFSFDVTTASCANDFVVTGTNLAGSVSPVNALDRLTVATGATGSTITIQNGGTTLTLIGGATNANTGPDTGTWVINADPTTEASNIAASIIAIGNGNVVGVTATSAGPVVTITALVPGATGNAIRLGGDVDGAGTGLTADNLNLQDGASDTVSIAAFNDLYVGCVTDGVSSPQAAWAYNTGGTIKTSVALSGDGKQVAFVQTIGGVANLSVLKWAVGSSVDAGVDVPALLATAYPACVPTSTAPCLVNIPFSGGADDTHSSPYYDFTPGSDTMYVGDDADRLHKFIGVFNGTPTEVTTTPWPVNLQYAPETISTTSPVFDSVSGNIFIADAVNPVGPFDGGFLYAVSASGGSVVRAFAADFPGVVDGPIVDSTSEEVYVFCTATDAAAGSAVLEFAAGSVQDSFVARQFIGKFNQSPGSVGFAGNFDNAFYSDSGGTGNLYVCGNATANTVPTLYQIPITITGSPAQPTLGTPNQGPALTTAPAACSPVTEFYNPNGGGVGVPRDLIFLSVTDLGQTTGPVACPANTGCIMSFDVTSGATITSTTAPAATFSVSGGASGVIVDNGVVAGTGSSTSPGGTSQIYYTPLAGGDCTTLTGIGGCLVQISQAALR